MTETLNMTPEQEELASKLTPMQRKFAIYMATGSMSQREAYVAAGGKATTTNAQDVTASKMLSEPKVNALYQSILNAAATSAVLTRTEALEILSTNARECEEPKDQHTAIKQLSDMEGWNAAKKTELSGEVAVSEVVRKVVD